MAEIAEGKAATALGPFPASIIGVLIANPAK